VVDVVDVLEDIGALADLHGQIERGVSDRASGSRKEIPVRVVAVGRIDRSGDARDRMWTAAARSAVSVQSGVGFVSDIADRVVVETAGDEIGARRRHQPVARVVRQALGDTVIAVRALGDVADGVVLEREVEGGIPR
jgi:hypothetical protein